MCTLGVASNSPDRKQQVANALRWLDATFGPTVHSAPYPTDEWSGRFPQYLNAVALLRLAPYVDMQAVNASLKLYERRCGRVPSDKQSGIVPIDLDIVVWRGEVVREAEFSRPYFAEGYRQVLTLLEQTKQTTSE